MAHLTLVREAAKKVIFFNGRAIKPGRGGGKGPAIKEKIFIKLKAGGGLRPYNVTAN